uniref:Uncharacterized protein n=1 Tax=Glossina pallidipes TaxID=7398 RepID=A0A1A9ZHU9_GLOPL
MDVMMRRKGQKVSLKNNRQIQEESFANNKKLLQVDVFLLMQQEKMREESVCAKMMRVIQKTKIIIWILQRFVKCCSSTKEKADKNFHYYSMDETNHFLLFSSEEIKEKEYIIRNDVDISKKSTFRGFRYILIILNGIREEFKGELSPPLLPTLSLIALRTQRPVVLEQKSALQTQMIFAHAEIEMAYGNGSLDPHEY